mmetsp:Transcript_20267/g.49700  ORF Transcript_20267/g.49700 Transcript_20267/m.49700 type:complete len:229 (+) Transcript_20267:79-765(+)
MPPLNQRNGTHWVFHLDPQKETLSNKRKSVSFASFAHEYPTIDRANYSPMEMINTWYCKPDFVEFALDIRHTVQIIERDACSQLLDDVNYTTRGSICRKECTARKRKQIRDGAKDCVLEAQDKSQYNAEYISSVYTQYSQPSIQEALKQADLDRHDANELVHSQLVEDFWNNYFSDAWITHLDDDGSPPGTTQHHEDPPNLLTDDSSFAETATELDGFDDSWLVGPVA